MKRARVIPVLLLKSRGLYKTVRFNDFRYVGDPVNVVKIFNEKQCDELIFLDISATKQGSDIDYKFIEEVASECFMPFSYGGGISNLHQIENLLKLGIEKVILNTIIFKDPSFLATATENFGSSTIIASVDVKMNFFGKYHPFSYSGYDTGSIQLMSFLKQIENSGAGEIMINSVDKDGLMNGYDVELAQNISSELNVPVVFCGGCKSFSDIKNLLTTTAVSAAGVGSIFIFHGPHKGVLINYPAPDEIGSIYN